MVSLTTAGLRFDSIMKTEAGMPFRGTIEPAEERAPPSYDFSTPRLVLRVLATCPVKTGSIIIDAASRKFILADHDTSFAYNELQYRSHLLFPVIQTVTWTRATTTTDALTNLPKGSGMAPLGSVSVYVDRVEREFIDTQLRAREETKRMVMNVEPKLNDLFDKMVVKRVDRVLGLWLAEVQ